jgi:hypothetical protein
MVFTKEEIELLQYAVSFLTANLPEAEDALDVSLDEGDIKALETKLYQE